MLLRTCLIRIMLAFLALAALGGILGVLAPGMDVVWRMVSTAVATAVACALMLAATQFIDRPEARLSSLYAMAVITAEFLLALSLIWELPQNLLPGRYANGIIALAMLYIAISQGPAAGFIRLVHRPSTRIAGITGVAGMAVALLMML